MSMKCRRKARVPVWDDAQGPQAVRHLAWVTYSSANQVLTGR